MVLDFKDQGVSDMSARSVLIRILDPMTRQHTTFKQSESFDVFKAAVLGMSRKDVSKPDPMQVESVAGSTQCAGSVQDSGCVGSEACVCCGGRCCLPQLWEKRTFRPGLCLKKG